MVEEIKSILNINDENKDLLLNIYIEHAKNEAERYTRREYIDLMDDIVVQMVVEKYNKRFNEGIANTSTSGLNSSFLNGYSQSILNQLNDLRKKVKILWHLTRLNCTN